MFSSNPLTRKLSLLLLIILITAILMAFQISYLKSRDSNEFNRSEIKAYRTEKKGCKITI
jgi:CHASE3 domain sensor protein